MINITPKVSDSRMISGNRNESVGSTTSAMLGVFHEDARTRQEFLDILKRP
jgi:GTP cyclohydrolase I